jgi:hypothetical protein
MTEYNKDLVAYHIEKARDTLEDALKAEAFVQRIIKLTKGKKRGKSGTSIGK